jgi:hypothetical protein
MLKCWEALFGWGGTRRRKRPSGVIGDTIDVLNERVMLQLRPRYDNDGLVAVFVADLNMGRGGRKWRMRIQLNKQHLSVTSSVFLLCVASPTTGVVQSTVMPKNGAIDALVIAAPQDSAVIVRVYAARLNHRGTTHTWMQLAVGVVDGTVTLPLLQTTEDNPRENEREVTAAEVVVLQQDKPRAAAAMRQPRDPTAVSVAYRDAYEKALSRTDGVKMPLFPSGDPMDAHSLYRTFTGHAAAPLLFFLGIDSCRCGLVAARRILRWCADSVAMQAKLDVTGFERWPVRDRLWFVARVLRFVPRLMAHTEEDERRDVFSYPFIDPNPLRAQTDCEDLAALHVYMFRMLERIHSAGDATTDPLVWAMATVFVPHYTPVVFAIASYLGNIQLQMNDDKNGFHMVAGFVPTSVMARVANSTSKAGGSSSDEKHHHQLPVLIMEAMTNLNPLADAHKQHEDGWMEVADRNVLEWAQAGKLPLRESNTLTSVAKARIYGQVHRMYSLRAPFVGEYAPLANFEMAEWAAAQSLETQRFVCPMTPTRDDRQSYDGSLWPYARLAPLQMHPMFDSLWTAHHWHYTPVLVDKAIVEAAQLKLKHNPIVGEAMVVYI